MNDDTIDLTGINDAARQHLRLVLTELFGAIAVRQLDGLDWEDLYAVIDNHAGEVQAKVANHYGDQMLQQARAGAMNVLRGVLAGSIMKGREHGEEPHPDILALAHGSADIA